MFKSKALEEYEEQKAIFSNTHCQPHNQSIRKFWTKQNEKYEIARKSPDKSLLTSTFGQKLKIV